MAPTACVWDWWWRRLPETTFLSTMRCANRDVTSTIRFGMPSVWSKDGRSTKISASPKRQLQPSNGLRCSWTRRSPKWTTCSANTAWAKRWWLFTNSSGMSSLPGTWRWLNRVINNLLISLPTYRHLASSMPCSACSIRLCPLLQRNCGKHWSRVRKARAWWSHWYRRLHLLITHIWKTSKLQKK